MSSYFIDEFVICEFAAWDGDFIPPSSEWDPNARQPAPTNGIIELSVYARPNTNVVLPAIEIAIFKAENKILQNANISISTSAAENAIVTLSSIISQSIDTTIAALENSLLQIENTIVQNVDVIISSPENASLDLDNITNPTLDIVFPSPENAILQSFCSINQNLDIVLPSPENATLVLATITYQNIDIVLPSPENATVEINIILDNIINIVLPSPTEGVILKHDAIINQSLNIVFSSPVDAVYQLNNYSTFTVDIVLPSPENATLQLPLTVLLDQDLVNYNIRYNDLLIDRINCTSKSPGITFNVEILVFLLLEDFLNKYFIDIVESFMMSSMSKARLGLSITEYFTILDSQKIHWDGTNTINDTFSIHESIKLRFVKIINEALSLTDSTSVMLELLLSEFVGFTETALPNWNTTRELSSKLDLEDNAILKLCVIIIDTLELTETQSTILQLRLNEFCLIAATVIPNWNTVREVTETLQFVDSLVQKLTLFLTDALELTDAQSLLLSFTLSEFMAVKDNLTSTMSSVKEITDTISIQDALYQLLGVILTEALVCTDDAPLCQLGLAIYEYLGFTELLRAPGVFSVESSDTLNAIDTLSLSYIQIISDVFSLVDVSSVLGVLLNSVVENFSITESISASLKAILLVSDPLALTEVVASQGRLYTILHDALILNTVVEIDGEVWECYVLNTPKFFPSIYSGFNFNSYCVFQNRAYGCKADGIYELTGSTDNGTVINTGVQLSETKFGLPNQKRFRKAYIGVSGTKPLLLMETETGKMKTYSIDVDGEVDASRSLRSKKWKLTVTDFESLDFIKLIPVILAK